jgi:hypothetical protein
MNFQKLTFTRLSSGIHWALPISDLPFSNMTPQMDIIYGPEAGKIMQFLLPPLFPWNIAIVPD